LDDFNRNGPSYLTIEQLEQGIANLETIDNLSIHRTASPEETLDFLESMTNQIIISSKTLEGIQKIICHPNLTYAQWKELTQKDWTVHEVFAKQILQLKGIQQSYSNMISTKYENPLALWNALQKGEEARTCLNGIGKKSAKSILELFTSQEYTEDDSLSQ
jgi:hypothetical protein